jgi:hypothetical protein
MAKKAVWQYLKPAYCQNGAPLLNNGVALFDNTSGFRSTVATAF